MDHSSVSLSRKRKRLCDIRNGSKWKDLEAHTPHNSLRGYSMMTTWPSARSYRVLGKGLFHTSFHRILTQLNVVWTRCHNDPGLQQSKQRPRVCQSLAQDHTAGGERLVSHGQRAQGRVRTCLCPGPSWATRATVRSSAASHTQDPATEGHALHAAARTGVRRGGFLQSIGPPSHEGVTAGHQRGQGRGCRHRRGAGLSDVSRGSLTDSRVKRISYWDRPVLVKPEGCKHRERHGGFLSSSHVDTQVMSVTLLIKINVMKATYTKDICLNFSFVENKVNLNSLLPPKKNTLM